MDLNVETLKKLDGDQVVAFGTWQGLLGMAREATAPDKDDDRKKIAAQLAAELNAVDSGGKDDKGKDKPLVDRYSANARNQIARLLSIVASEAEVPALVVAMKELAVREAARCALDRVPGDAASDALIAALDEVGPAFRAGVAGSLGDRSGAKVVKALQGLIDDEDHEVQMAAVDAMAKIPDAGNDAAIATVVAKCPCPFTRQAAVKARVRLAETLARSGDKAAARRIYEDIRRTDTVAPAQKKAAEVGIKAQG